MNYLKKIIRHKRTDSKWKIVSEEADWLYVLSMESKEKGFARSLSIPKIKISFNEEAEFEFCFSKKEFKI